MGLVFPALFSLGIMLITRYAGNVHLDVDAVLLGELAFAPFDRFEVAGYDLGPRHLWLMGGILVINLTLIVLFFKELKLATFDPGLAASLGLAPAVIHYGLMTLVSITAVGAFDAVGSDPGGGPDGRSAGGGLPADRPAAGDDLARVGIGAAAAGGYWLAHSLDASIAGSMAAMTGVVFAGLLLRAGPGAGRDLPSPPASASGFRRAMLAVHLLQHEGCPDERTKAAWPSWKSTSVGTGVCPADRPAGDDAGTASAAGRLPAAYR